MKKYFINALLCSTLITAVSCNKELDTTPTQSIDESVALTTSNDVKVALVGAYADFGDDDFYGGRIFMEPDLLGDVAEMDWTVDDGDENVLVALLDASQIGDPRQSRQICPNRIRLIT